MLTKHLGNIFRTREIRDMDRKRLNDFHTILFLAEKNKIAVLVLSST